MKNQKRGSLLLTVTAMVWGMGFVAQSASTKFIGPFTMQGIRYLLAALVLLPVRHLTDKLGLSAPPQTRSQSRRFLLCGIICGTILFAASIIQQFGIEYTTAGKAGFLTAQYIILVPILSTLFGHRPRGVVWLCAVMAVVGMFFLCVGEGFSVNRGDVLVLICALGFSGHIMYVDRVAGSVDGIRLSCIQFFTCAAWGITGMFIFENPSLKNILDCALPICYSGMVSGGVGYTLQILAQKDVQPAIASLIMSMEAVFSAVFGWLVLGQGLSGREIFGCVIMFAAIILAQLPGKKGMA